MPRQNPAARLLLKQPYAQGEECREDNHTHRLAHADRIGLCAKLFRKFLPHHETVKSYRWLRPFGDWLQHPNLWHLHRRSVAGGAAIGLFCGLIPAHCR